MAFVCTLRKAALAALAVVLAGVAASTAQAQEPWRGQATLYGWGAGIGGDFTPFAGAPTLSFDKSLPDVLEDLDAALFISGLATNGDVVVFGDLSYSASSKSGLVPPGAPASGEVSQTSVTLAAGRRVMDDGTTTVDFLGGARAWWLDGEVSVPAAGVSLAPQKTFIDPIVALRVNHRLTDRWTALGYLDIGGFGIGSDVTYQLAVTANYKISDRLYLSGGYRHLYVDYSDNGTAFEGAMSGPVLGATFQF